MNLMIKRKVNQNGNNYLACCVNLNGKDLILNFDSMIIMRLLDLSPNQIDKVLNSRDYNDIDLLSIKAELKTL